MPSPASGPTTVSEVLDAVLAEEPDRSMLIARSARWSYVELDRMADAHAAALAGLGVRPGTRVAASLPNDADVVALFHGAMRLGAVWVGLNRALAPPEKAYILEDSGSEVLLADSATIEQLSAADGLAAVRGVVVERGPEGAEWRAAVEAALGSARPAAPDPDTPAALAYTSGTTGYPKGAVHSQRNLLLPGAALVASRGYGPDLRKGDCLPLTILNMQVLTTLLVAQAGGCSVVMDRIDAEGVAGWIADEAVTTWNGPPALLHSLVHNDAVEPDRLGTLDEVWTGGADCPETLRSAFAAKFGIPVIATYGLTEAPTVVAIDPRDGEHREGGSGVPLPHFALSVRDDKGDEVRVGETGEICLAATEQGPWAGAYRPPLGYWRRPEATEELLRGGVVHTGDVGFIDPDGFLHVRDRRNQMINRGGANVYPAEVERVLTAAEGVEACAVFGVPDERLGERVAAAVQPAPGARLSSETLAAHCAAELAKYKVPDRFVIVESLARNSMGKIDRRQLRDLISAED